MRYLTVGPRKRSAAGRQTADTEPLVCRVAAAPDPAYKTRADRTALAADPTFSAAGQLLRLLLRLRQLADNRRAPRIPFR
ncbi:TPA: hypothetical protein ACXEXX_004512, partial [Klebsiella pneumoniae]